MKECQELLCGSMNGVDAIDQGQKGHKLELKGRDFSTEDHLTNQVDSDQDGASSGNKDE